MRDDLGIPAQLIIWRANLLSLSVYGVELECFMTWAKKGVKRTPGTSENKNCAARPTRQPNSLSLITMNSFSGYRGMARKFFISLDTVKKLGISRGLTFKFRKSVSS